MAIKFVEARPEARPAREAKPKAAKAEKPKFDRNAYQRAYMVDWRKRQKAKKDSR